MSKNKNDDIKSKNRNSLCSFKIKSLLFILAIIVLSIVLSPFLKFDTPLHASYVKLTESPKFNGNLKENNLLQNSIYLAKGKLRGPETILFVNDTLYTGLLNGQLVRVDNNGNVHKIVQIGEETDENICNDYGRDIKSKKKCGRPLGLRFKSPNFIYLIDAYYGLFKINLDSNEKHLILSSNDKIFDKPLVFGNDLDIDDEDNIYFSDSSIDREVNEAVELHVEAKPDGRVFCYNEKSGELTLIMDKLRFPNGIQLTPNKDALIIAEHCTARLIKYYLKGEKQGLHEVFATLPGFPDNIRISGHNTLFVGFAASRHTSKPVLLDIFGEYPFFRSIVGSILNLRYLSLNLPKYALCAEYDFNEAKILRSWHDPSGKTVECVTCMTLHKNKLYLGSFYIDHISVVDY